MLYGDPRLGDFFDSTNKRLEHIMASETLAAIEPEGIFVEVHLQILRADVVVDATNPVLRQAPEPLNRVRVRIARDIYVRCVVDAPMNVPPFSDRIIDV